MLMVTDSDAEAVMPMYELGGSKLPSMDLSISTSRVGFSDDFVTDTENISFCILGVSCRDIRDGKCFSSEPYPRSINSVSGTKGFTSHLSYENNAS